VEIILPDGASISKTIANLAPNAQVQVSQDDSGVQSITFTQPGTQRLRVFVDFDGDVAEIDENNNNAALDIIVEAATNPDQSP
jgi:subtilase family serine protease